MNGINTNPYGWKRIGWAMDNKAQENPKLKYPTSVIATLIYMRALYRRVKKIGKSLIIQIDGEHQTGKSRIGGYFFAWILDPTFGENRKIRICTSDTGILEAVKNINDKQIKGAAIVIDEGGVAVGRQDFADRLAKAINKTIQIIGYLHPIIIIISPIKQQILKSIERMSNVYFHFERGSTSFTRLFPYNLRYNSISEKTLTPKPTISIFGCKYVLNEIKVSPLPAWMDEEYKEIEMKNKPPMFDKLREQAMETKVREAKKDPMELVNVVVEDYRQTGKNCVYLSKSSMKEEAKHISFEPNRIRPRLGVSDRDAHTIAIEAEAIVNKKVL